MPSGKLINNNGLWYNSNLHSFCVTQMIIDHPNESMYYTMPQFKLNGIVCTYISNPATSRIGLNEYAYIRLSNASGDIITAYNSTYIYSFFIWFSWEDYNFIPILRHSLNTTPTGVPFMKYEIVSRIYCNHMNQSTQITHCLMAR